MSKVLRNFRGDYLYKKLKKSSEWRRLEDNLWDWFEYLPPISTAYNGKQSDIHHDAAF